MLKIGKSLYVTSYLRLDKSDARKKEKEINKYLKLPV